METLKQRIKDAIWELKNIGKTITVKSVFDKANGTISFNELPEILSYLESVKDKFLWTKVNGFLELTPIGKATVKDLISK